MLSHLLSHTSAGRLVREIGGYTISLTKLLLCHNVDISRTRIVARPGAGREGRGRGIAAFKGPQRHKSLIVPSVARDRHLDASRIPFICISVLLGLPLRRVYLFIRLAIYRLNVASFSRPSSLLVPLGRSRTCACTAIPRPGSPSLEVVACRCV